MADNITLDIQMAGYRFDQYDEKGPTTYSAFLKEFRAFPWSAQVGKANGGSEPTIGVKNHSSKIDLWVSAAKHEDSHVYLVGVVYPKQKRSLLGLGKPVEVRWIEIYVAEEAATVESTFKTYFGGSFDELMSQLRKLPAFAEMETPD